MSRYKLKSDRLELYTSRIKKVTPLFIDANINPIAIKLLDEHIKEKKKQYQNNIINAKQFLISKLNEDIPNNEITILMEAVQREFNINEEDLFSIYVESKKESKNIKNNIEQIKPLEKIKNELNKLLDSDISIEELSKLSNELSIRYSINKNEIIELNNYISSLFENKIELNKLNEKINSITDIEEEKVLAAFLDPSIDKKVLYLKLEHIVKKYNISKTEFYRICISKKQKLDMLKSKEEELKLNYIEKEISILQTSNLDLATYDCELDKLASRYKVDRNIVDRIDNGLKLIREKEEIEKRLSKKISGKKISKKSKITKYDKLPFSVTDSSKTYIEAGRNLVVLSKQDAFERFVKESQNDPVPVYQSLNIMNILENSKDIKKAKEVLETTHDFDSNVTKILNIVYYYSPYGEYFKKKTRKYLMSKPERLKQFILDKSSIFTINKDKNNNIDEQIKKLMDLKSQVEEAKKGKNDYVIEAPLSIKTI